MTRKQETYMMIFAVLAAVVAVVLVIVYRKQLSQSVRGKLTGNYFSDSELTYSATAKHLGLDNTPSAEALANLHLLRDNVLNPARQALGSAITVNSAYRSPVVNAAAGGVDNSQHLSGQAADITAGSIEKNKLLFSILVSQAKYDQLIWEHTSSGQWIHVSYVSGSGRRQMLAHNGSKYTNIASNWQNNLV